MSHDHIEPIYVTELPRQQTWRAARPASEYLSELAHKIKNFARTNRQTMREAIHEMQEVLNLMEELDENFEDLQGQMGGLPFQTELMVGSFPGATGEPQLWVGANFETRYKKGAAFASRLDLKKKLEETESWS